MSSIAIPSYIPTTCSPSRVSSACACIASETSAPAACSTGQVVVNPSFYGPPPIPQPQLSPWVIGHDSGSPGCVFNPSSYDDAARDQYFADPASMSVALRLLCTPGSTKTAICQPYKAYRKTSSIIEAISLIPLIVNAPSPRLVAKTMSARRSSTCVQICCTPLRQ